jgi:hypothetical protein
MKKFAERASASGRQAYFSYKENKVKGGTVLKNGVEGSLAIQVISRIFTGLKISEGFGK